MQNNSRFLDGFIMGALVGGAAFFLLGTEKGNKILKMLSQDGLGDITGMFSDFEEGVEQGVKKTVKNVEEQEIKDIKKIEEKIEKTPDPTPITAQPNNRRFFRKK